MFASRCLSPYRRLSHAEMGLDKSVETGMPSPVSLPSKQAAAMDAEGCATADMMPGLPRRHIRYFGLETDCLWVANH